MFVWILRILSVAMLIGFFIAHGSLGWLVALSGYVLMYVAEEQAMYYKRQTHKWQLIACAYSEMLEQEKKIRLDGKKGHENPQ